MGREAALLLFRKQGLLRSPSGINPLATSAFTLLVSLVHQLVTERPSVEQNRAHVTTISLPQNPSRKISSTPEPLFQALSSLIHDFY
nr:hypothetical protein [uncultured Pseudomonas sp.]